MKIEIDIDIESIVKAALKKQQSEDIIPTETTTTNNRSKWEYGRKNNRRRTPEEMALHKLEQEKGRRLTPEEKGEAKATIQIDTTTENEVKEAAIKKDRIDKIAAEGMAAASKELAEEENIDPIEIHDKVFPREDGLKRSMNLDSKELAEEEELVSGAYPDAIEPLKPEATIPETKDLKNLNSLFRD